MKNVILFLLGIMISMYTVGICFSVFSVEIRKNALEEHVSRVLSRTLEEEYQARDEEEVRETLKRELALDVGKNGYIEVDVCQLDLKKGLIHVVVKEYFRQFNGKEKMLTCEKTVIMDSAATPSYSAGAIAAMTEPVEMHTSNLMTGVSVESSGSSIYSNAQVYYQTYEGKMIFKPIDETEAGVFYGTRAKESSTGYLVFETIGWRVTIKNSLGHVIDQVYYALDGQNIHVADNRTVDGYKYKLYNITLNTLKNRFSAAANEALKKADCSIVFDACIVVKTNGVRSGGMTDDGIAWGTVYTTYDGIVNAAGWTAKTKETLKSYFNKEIPDMFFDVNINCGEGIASVIGSGKYCYGTEITIDATPQSGYRFLEWIGPFTSSQKTFTFTVYEDITIQATTKREEVAVNLYRNLDTQDTCVETLFFQYGTGVKRLKDMGWVKDGYHQTGWSTSRIVQQAYFGIEQEITEAWMEQVAPSEDLYATWAPNKYRIVFCGNGATGTEIYSVHDYTEMVEMPSDGFAFLDGSLSGWSLSSTADGAEYACGEMVSVAELALSVGLELEDGVPIYLYAQKDCAPRVLCHQVYVSLSDAIEGVVTENWLSGYIRAMDKEDGEIPYGRSTNGVLQMLDFVAERYLECREECCIVEKVYVKDSVGNEVYQDVEVHVIDDVRTTVAREQKRIRFISKKYYKDERGIFIAPEEGGLAEDSIWRWNPEYVTLLEETFQ